MKRKRVFVAVGMKSGIPEYAAETKSELTGKLKLAGYVKQGSADVNSFVKTVNKDRCVYDTLIIYAVDL